MAQGQKPACETSSGPISGERIAKPASVNLFDGRHATLLTGLTARMRDERFDRLDFIVSFVMSSGLDLVEEVLEDAIARGARVRVLTTDYLGITQRSALARLLDRSQDSLGALRVRVFHDDGTSFHPKGYLFWSSQGDVAAAVVGSSNLSRPGLVGGIEWNVGLETVVPMLERFTELWDDPRSVELTADWLRNYHPPVVDTSLAPVIELEEAPVQPVEPRPIQREALDGARADADRGSSGRARRDGDRSRQDVARSLRLRAPAVRARAVHRAPRGDPPAEPRRVPAGAAGQ